MDALAEKREREKQMVSRMIALYCRGKHSPHPGGALCLECAALQTYALDRAGPCPRMEVKTFCSCCPVHCCRPEMRERIRRVMRYAGPRMLFHHPAAAIRHLAETRREKKRLEGSR